MAFDVPLWVESGLAEGKLRVFGVVRNLRGEIVYHLKDASKIVEKANGKTKVIAMGIGVLAGGTSLAYKFLSNKEKLARKIDEFDKTLQNYLNEVLKTNLTIDKISELQQVCDGLIETLNKVDVNKVRGTDGDKEKLNEIVNAIKKLLST